MSTQAKNLSFQAEISPEVYKGLNRSMDQPVDTVRIEESGNLDPEAKLGYEYLGILELTDVVAKAEFTEDEEVKNQASDVLLDKLVQISEKEKLPLTGEHSQEVLLNKVIETIELRKQELKLVVELNENPQNVAPEKPASDESEAPTEILPQSKKSLLTRFKELSGPVKFRKDGSTEIKELGEYPNIKAKLARLVNPALAAYDSDGTYKISDINKYEGIRKKVLQGVGAVAVAGVGLYLINKGFSSELGGSDQLTASATSSPKPSLPTPDLLTPSPVSGPEVESALKPWSNKVGNGEGVSQVIDGYFSSKGVSLAPEQMKDFIDGAIQRDLLNPKNVSGLTPQEVYGGYGYPVAGTETTFSPEFMQYANEFLKETKD